MTGGVLTSPGEAAQRIVEVLEGNGQCRLSVREERAFTNGWLPLGAVSLESGNGTPDELETMITNGAFKWRLPSVQDAKNDLSKCLGDMRGREVKDRVDGVLNSMASIAARAGLLHPAFDASALEGMPFRRPTTIVADTSGVLQGALDFVARHLHPAGRVKVPAIVHMEIVNSAERFFRLRRGRNDKLARRINELIEHLKSQGGQRVLLRLELRTDTEIERTYLLGDPLRDAFRPDRDQDLSQLDISVPVPAYVDRLILEAARHHQAQSGPSHGVRLLTGDQGLARMALAEGVTPLYFKAIRAADFFGKRFAGQTFDPFSGDIQRTPLTSVLWELATAFGAARLESDNGSTFEVSALGEGMDWSPYHSFDDLLWCKHTAPSPAVSAPATATPGMERASAKVTPRARDTDARAGRHEGGGPPAEERGMSRGKTTRAKRAAGGASQEATRPYRVKVRLGKPGGGTHEIGDVLDLGEEYGTAVVADLVASGTLEPIDGVEAVADDSDPGPDGDDTDARAGRHERGVTFGRFDVGRLFRLICALDDNQEMSSNEVTEFLGTQSRRGSEEYRRFLLSAHLIAMVGNRWRAESGIRRLSAALRNERIDELREGLVEAPSLAAFAAYTRGLGVGQALDPSYGSRGAATYRALGEVTLIGAAADAKFYSTPAAPDARTFAEVALARFSELDAGSGLVAVGAWLESLIREDGIHPEVARLRLEEANARGFLRRSTEGSTPQTRHDTRVVHVLRTEHGEPVVAPIRLYRGDYLIPGKASVSLRIEGPTP